MSKSDMALVDIEDKLVNPQEHHHEFSFLLRLIGQILASGLFIALSVAGIYMFKFIGRIAKLLFNKIKSSSVVKFLGVVKSSPPKTDWCRICFIGTHESSKELHNYCNCKGSIEFLHKECLDQWFVKHPESEYTCNICLAPFVGYKGPSPLKNCVRFLCDKYMILVLHLLTSTFAFAGTHAVCDLMDPYFPMKIGGYTMIILLFTYGHAVAAIIHPLPL